MTSPRTKRTAYLRLLTFHPFLLIVDVITDDPQSTPVPYDGPSVSHHVGYLPLLRNVPSPPPSRLAKSRRTVRWLTSLSNGRHLDFGDDEVIPTVSSQPRPRSCRRRNILLGWKNTSSKRGSANHSCKPPLMPVSERSRPTESIAETWI